MIKKTNTSSAGPLAARLSSSAGPLAARIILAALLAPAILLAQTAQLRWDTQLDRPVDHPLIIYRGETLDLLPRIVQGTDPVAITNQALYFRYREPALIASNLYREVAITTNAAPGTLQFTWTPELDILSPTYDYEFVVGSNPRVHGRITMRGTISHMASSNAPPPSTRWITDIELNAAIAPLASAQYNGRSDLIITPESSFTFAPASGTITAYIGTATTVVIPYAIGGVPVKSIGVRAFASKPVTSVIIPASIIGISESAFEFCAQLQEITAPSVYIILDGAFMHCTTLKSATLPAIQTLFGNVFFGCTALTAVNFSGPPPVLILGTYIEAPAVTNYVSDPAALGWPSTFGGRPVRRPTLHTDDLRILGQPAATAASVTILSNRITLVESNLISVGSIAATALQPADITGKLNITDGTATNLTINTSLWVDGKVNVYGNFSVVGTEFHVEGDAEFDDTVTVHKDLLVHGTATGKSPTLPQHFATKNYVDSLPKGPTNAVAGFTLYDTGSNILLRVNVSNLSFTVHEVLP
ncbi:MAG: leucine-rich repeat domain-containing protein [Bacilli bacterium]